MTFENSENEKNIDKISNDNNQSNIFFWLKEMILSLMIVLGLFLLFAIFLFKETSTVNFYNPMGDVINAANEAKDQNFAIRKSEAKNDGYSRETYIQKKEYNENTIAWTDQVIKSWNVNGCFEKFEWNYDKVYACLKTFSVVVDTLKNETQMLPASKKIYDLNSCAYSTNYNDFTNCMKIQLYHNTSFYSCLVFEEDTLQIECFDRKWNMYLSTRWILEYFHIENKKNKILFETTDNWKIVRKKITSEILKDHPEFLMKYKFFAPKMDNFKELKTKMPELFENKNFINSMKNFNIIY